MHQISAMIKYIVYLSRVSTLLSDAMVQMPHHSRFRRSWITTCFSQRISI